MWNMKCTHVCLHVALFSPHGVCNILDNSPMSLSNYLATRNDVNRNFTIMHMEHHWSWPVHRRYRSYWYRYRPHQTFRFNLPKWITSDAGILVVSMALTGVSFRAWYSKCSFGTWSRQTATLERLLSIWPSVLVSCPGGHVLKQVHKRRICDILMVNIFLGALAVQHAVIHTFDLIQWIITTCRSKQVITYTDESD